MKQKEFNLYDEWILKKVLNSVEREKLFILLESAGVVIYKPTREHSDHERFKYLIHFSYQNQIIVAGLSSVENSPYSRVRIVQYRTLLKAIKQCIKKNSKDIWEREVIST